MLIGTAYGQTTYSCYYKKICVYDDSTKDYTTCTTAMEYNQFVISKDNKTIYHKEDDFKFFYTVEEFSKDSLGTLNYIVVDEHKLEQAYQFDEKKKIITSLVKTKETNAIIIYTVKSIY